MNVRSIAFLSFLQRARLSGVPLRMMVNQCVGIILNSCVIADSSQLAEDEVHDVDGDEQVKVRELRMRCGDQKHLLSAANTYDLFGTFIDADTSFKPPSPHNTTHSPKVQFRFVV